MVPSAGAMKRKVDEKDRSCSSRNKLDPIPLDLKMATVTRLPAKSRMKSHQNKLLCRVESSVHLGGAMKRKERDNQEEDEKDTNPSKSELDSLPLDLKMAILTRMPAKSLMKFRCVSKMWFSIIRSQGFIDSFFEFSMSSKQSRFIVALSNPLLVQPGERLTFFFSFSQEEEESSSLLPTFEMAIPTSFCDSSHSLASFHGILAVKADSCIICNPSTEQFVKLPRPISYVGYDPIDDQYKALSLTTKDLNDTSGHLEHKVLTLGGGQGWRTIKGTPLPYRATPPTVCINGFLYYPAFLTQTREPFLVCFDVRSEKLSFINVPRVVVQWGKDAVFLEYKGKLASIARYPYGRFPSFDLWILEDTEKHEWSMQTCVFPSSVWDDVDCGQISFPGTNKAGEIIMAPKLLPHYVRPFYIFYYNVETKHIRRVRLLGIGDTEEFRRSYGFDQFRYGSYVLIAPQHVESVGFFKDPII